MINLNFKKKTAEIVLSCVVMAGVFISPLMGISSKAETYKADVYWESNGRDVYANHSYSGGFSPETNHYIYGDRSDVTLTIDSCSGVGGNLTVYSDGQQNYIWDGNPEEYSIKKGGCIKAKWDGPQKIYLYTGYPIVFKDKGGAAFSGKMAIEDSFCFWGDTTVSLSNPSRTGYTFEGWYEDPDCTVAYEGWSGTALTSNPGITVYASWKRNAGNTQSEGTSSMAALQQAEEALPVTEFISESVVNGMPEAAKRVGVSADLSTITTMQGFASAVTKISANAKATAKTKGRAVSVTVYSDEPMTFSKEVLDAISAADVNFSYVFRHEGKIYMITVPRGVNVDFGGSMYEGPLYVGKILGTSQVIE